MSTYYTPKTQLTADSYKKDGLTMIKLGNTEYVKMSDVVGHNLTYYRNLCSEGTMLRVRIDGGRSCWFVSTSEMKKLVATRRYNKEMVAHGKTSPEHIEARDKLIALSDFGKGWSRADLEEDKQPESLDHFVIINGVRGYEKDGTVYLNIEDVARGLGFTEIKDGVEYVRWRTVNAYLQDFKFSQEVAKDDFIPENIFYRLAMKAKNEVAEKFQILVSDEVLPKIRKQGYYVRPDIKPVENNNTNDELLEALKAQLAIQTKIVERLEQKNLR